MFKVKINGTREISEVLEVDRNERGTFFLIWNDIDESFMWLDYKCCKKVNNEMIVNVKVDNNFRDIEDIKKIVYDKFMSDNFKGGI